MKTKLSFCQRPALTTMTLLLLGSLAVQPAMAETRYVKPSLTITVRQGQNNSSKLVATVPLGTAVELVRGGKDWSVVRLQNGAEGWVRSRYLSDAPILPPGTVEDETGPAGAPLSIAVRFKELIEKNNRLQEELVICSNDKTTLVDKYQTLANDPNGVPQVKNSLSEAQQQIEELREQLATAQIENTVMKKNESIKWFLAGSSVLLIGWLIGRLTATSRKKRSSLL
jgi:SH3 domain protein